MSDEFIGQFIRDYYVEADDHLAVLRRVLLTLESSEEPVDERTNADLFRALHTLKGLSGMVGFAEVERLAHALEDRFRAALPRGAVASADLVEDAFEGVRLINESLDARRAGNRAPDVAGFIAALERAVAPPSAPLATSVRSAITARVEAARDAGLTLMQFVFTPTPDLASRGITVEKVRATLQSAGELLEATPRVSPGGVEFHFILGFPSGADVSELQIEGVISAPYELPQTQATPAPPAQTGGVVRVELSRLDELMRHVGELVISRSRFDDALRAATFEDQARAWALLQETNTAMERQLRALREAVMRARLVPIAEVFDRLKFAAREIARENGKLVEVELSGQETEIDKLVVDRMMEPLLHIVRNAVSHGIESPDVRSARGKEPRGRLQLRAAAIGDRVRIEVEDDGRGIDPAQVAQRARSKGLHVPHDEVDDDALLDLLCTEGFSTRETADLASGRGVGMSVVRATVKELGGELTLHTELNQCTVFRIELPLTLMIVEALLTRVGTHLMAVPMPSVREILQVEPSAVTRFENNEIMSYRNGVISLVRLSELFGQSPSAGRFLYVLVVGTDNQPVGLITDKIIGAREIVVRPVDDPLVAAPGIAGATELADGRLVLILDATALARLGREQKRVTQWMRV